MRHRIRVAALTLVVGALTACTPDSSPEPEPSSASVQASPSASTPSRWGPFIPNPETCASLDWSRFAAYGTVGPGTQPDVFKVDVDPVGGECQRGIEESDARVLLRFAFWTDAKQAADWVNAQPIMDPDGLVARGPWEACIRDTFISKSPAVWCRTGAFTVFVRISDGTKLDAAAAQVVIYDLADQVHALSS